MVGTMIYNAVESAMISVPGLDQKEMGPGSILNIKLTLIQTILLANFLVAKLKIV